MTDGGFGGSAASEPPAVIDERIATFDGRRMTPSYRNKRKEDLAEIRALEADRRRIRLLKRAERVAEAKTRAKQAERDARLAEAERLRAEREAARPLQRPVLDDGARWIEAQREVIDGLGPVSRRVLRALAVYEWVTVADLDASKDVWMFLHRNDLIVFKGDSKHEAKITVDGLVVCGLIFGEDVDGSGDT